MNFARQPADCLDYGKHHDFACFTSPPTTGVTSLLIINPSLNLPTLWKLPQISRNKSRLLTRRQFVLYELSLGFSCEMNRERSGVGNFLDAFLFPTVDVHPPPHIAQHRADVSFDRTEYGNPEDCTYWYNPTTRESIWEKPEGLSSSCFAHSPYDLLTLFCAFRRTEHLTSGVVLQKKAEYQQK